MATTYPYHATRAPQALRLDADATDMLRPGWPEFSVLLLALGVGLLASLGDGRLTTIANFVTPTLLIVGLGIGVMKMLRTGVMVVWTPLFWMRVSLIAYCGVGSLVPLFVNDETALYIEAFYQYYPADVTKYNLVVCTFTILTLATASAIVQVLHQFRPRADVARRVGLAPSRFDMKTVGLVFLTVGGVVRFFIQLPAELGVADYELAGAVSQLGFGLVVGYFLLGLWSLRARSPVFYVVLAICAADIAVGLLLFAKAAAMFPLVVISIAAIYHRPTLRRTVALSLLIVGFYFAITPVINYSRSISAATYGAGAAIPLDGRIDILRGYTPGAAAVTRDDALQTGWSRLSYVNAGTFAIGQYDTGQPGDSLRHLSIVWIPRVLYPDKPSITDLSREFNMAATGNFESQSNPGLPAEAYWWRGWLGVVIFSVGVAALFVAWSVYAINVMRREAWHLLLVVLLGMRTGIRIDGMLVADVVGPIAAAVLIHAALSFANALIPKRFYERWAGAAVSATR